MFCALALPLTVTLRSPSVRRICTGPSTWDTSATASSRIGPAAVGSCRARSSSGVVGAVPVRSTTSCSTPLVVSWVTVAPRKAWETSCPTVASVSPWRAAACWSTRTPSRGALTDRSLVTSVSPVISPMARCTVSAAVRSSASSAADTMTWIWSELKPAPPPPAPMVIVPASVRVAVRSRSTRSTSAASASSVRVTE